MGSSYDWEICEEACKKGENIELNLFLPVVFMLIENRFEAGLLLSEKLQNYCAKKNTLVLAIPKGGVPVAKMISDNLYLDLDILATKKIEAPYQKELAVGAVGPEGTIVLNEKLIEILEISREYLENKAAEKSDQIVKNIVKFGKNRKSEFNKKTIILVDDGISTGSTVEVAIKYLRKKKVQKIVLAVPVLPRTAILKFKKKVDELVYLEAPYSFRAVGQFYKSFPQITDNEVEKLMKKNK